MLYQVPYTKIGISFFAVLGVIVFFLFWLHKSTYDQCNVIYDVHFSKSVSGLRKGDSVLYNGVIAGRVKSIFVKKTDIETVIVRICLMPEFPVKADAHATLETKSIAGVAVIAVMGGTNEAPILKPGSKQRFPVIPSQPSRVEKIIDSAGTILKDVGTLFDEAQKEQLRNILKNINETIPLINKNLVKFDKIQAHFLMAADKNKGSLSELFGQGTQNMIRFFQQGSEAMQAVKSLANTIERSPSRFLYKDSSKGVTLQ